MDSLTEIISRFSNHDVKEFRAFINRQKQLKERKDLDLFESIVKNPQGVYHTNLGGEDYSQNLNAYHAIRKRLYKHVTDYIVLKQTENDLTSRSTVNGYLSLAQYLFDQNAPQAAWSYLEKAEKLAERSEHFDLICSICKLQLDHALDEMSPPLKTIIRKLNAARKKANTEEKAIIAQGVIRQQFDELMHGRHFNIAATIEKVLRFYRLTEMVIEQPRLLNRILSMVRTATLVTKEFETFIPYTILLYEKAKSNESFNKSNHTDKLDILYMICHSLFRNRQFETAQNYLVEYLENIEAGIHSQYQRHYPRYVLIQSSLYNYTGLLKKAIELTQNTLNSGGLSQDDQNTLDMRLNVVVYYFNHASYSQANKALMEIGHTDKWCEERMGRDWLLRKHLIEIVLQYELHHEDIALNRIRSLQRQFKEELHQQAYRKAAAYLEFVRGYIQFPGIIKDKAYMAKANLTFASVPENQLGLQTMAFYCWLKSKFTQKEYYSLLLETVRSREAKDVALLKQ